MKLTSANALKTLAAELEKVYGDKIPMEFLERWEKQGCDTVVTFDEKWVPRILAAYEKLGNLIANNRRMQIWASGRGKAYAGWYIEEAFLCRFMNLEHSAVENYCRSLESPHAEKALASLKNPEIKVINLSDTHAPKMTQDDFRLCSERNKQFIFEVNEKEFTILKTALELGQADKGKTPNDYLLFEVKEENVHYCAVDLQTYDGLVQFNHQNGHKYSGPGEVLCAVLKPAYRVPEVKQ